MTPEDLAKLTPKQRQAVMLRATGLSAPDVARKMGLRGRANVYTLEWSARQRLAKGKPVTPVRTRPPKRGGAPLGSKYDKSEPPRVTRARIERELAEGKRCTHQMRRGPCSLLLPCADHDLALGLAL